MPSAVFTELGNIKQLTDYVCNNLKNTSAAQNRRLAITVKPVNDSFVNRLLAEFDRVKGQDLDRERRILAGSGMSTGSVSLPATYQREVIREVFSGLDVLPLINVSFQESSGITVSLFYEDYGLLEIEVPNGGIVYEGQEIPLLGASVKNDYAYLASTKLALKASNEVLYFSANSGINWEAWAENISVHARIIKQLINARIIENMLRSSDGYMSKIVSNEAFVASATGLIKTVQFPLVRPFQQRDIQGNEVGSPEYPVVIAIGGVVIPYYTGADSLAVGTYWRFNNLNLGYIQLVNQKGGIAGANATGTISYSTPTNLIKFDLNPSAGVDYRKHLNLLIEKIGDQKAMLTSQRYARPDFVLMSEMLSNEISKAEQFSLMLARSGTGTDQSGDFSQVRGVQVVESNSVNDLGDNRILLGKRGLTNYIVAKPFSTGDAFEFIGKTGRPTGEKIAYGEEYSAIHTPKPVCNRYASILVYDSVMR